MHLETLLTKIHTQQNLHPKTENVENRDFEVAISSSQQNIFANGFKNQKELSKIY